MQILLKAKKEIPAWTSSAPPDLDEQKYDQGSKS
ncbi:hypothetical protein CCACVL1_20479 [Corchorus capsularis]|uniref:Uncharacterized protein n=1 Tax=Corchorus capsularis TaxID=210143 RepID=A0A1R3HB06_COCAP|nr:hypothetical protein CCACVL1_20479 [Corchorus capsularis]